MKYAVMVAVSVMAISFTSGLVLADGCYMCSGGGYVAYTGDDTFAKRSAAKDQFGCDVSGTTSSCSNPKGTVSFAAQEPLELIACDGHKSEDKDSCEGECEKEEA